MDKHSKLPWTIIDEPRNIHYRNKRFGQDYEATMQHCFFIESSEPPEHEHFVADVIVAAGELGTANAAFIANACNEYDSLKARAGLLDELIVLSSNVTCHAAMLAYHTSSLSEFLLKHPRDKAKELQP
jgi:hypothetical protein